MAAAALSVGFPVSVKLHANLNAANLAYTVMVGPQQTQANVEVFGTFVGTLRVYTSANGTFSDAVKQGSDITAPQAATSYPLPAGTTAVRVQNHAYTSGDLHVGIDCEGGVHIIAGVAESAGP